MLIENEQQSEAMVKIDIPNNKICLAPNLVVRFPASNRSDPNAKV